MFQKKKRFGQHFLINQKVLESICHYAQLNEGVRCVEIGPGQGALTKHLLKTQAHLQAIEIDRRLEPMLKKLSNKHDQFSYIMSDALMVDWDKLLAEPTTIVGNLPYEISTPLLFQLLHARKAITQMIFLLQKEVVDRICAEVGTKAYGRLSVMLQYYFTVKALDIVPPEDFSPPPKVMSQVVSLIPKDREWVDHDKLSVFVKFLFAYQRKMIRQRFKGYLEPFDWDNIGIDPTSRPQDLDLDSILTIYQHLETKGIDFAALA